MSLQLSIASSGSLNSIYLEATPTHFSQSTYCIEIPYAASIEQQNHIQKRRELNVLHRCYTYDRLMALHYNFSEEEFRLEYCFRKIVIERILLLMELLDSTIFSTQLTEHYNLVEYFFPATSGSQISQSKYILSFVSTPFY